MKWLCTHDEDQLLGRPYGLDKQRLASYPEDQGQSSAFDYSQHAAQQWATDMNLEGSSHEHSLK
jgi:hypothetical protein